MRQVRVPQLNREVSVLGFGCASLGSRISAADGHRAIARAIELGVNWFDVAPPYGDGHAEALLGQALEGKRDKLVICTKFGISPPQIPPAARLLRPLARKIVSTLPALRAAAAKARPVGARLPIDAKAIEASVIRSMRLLRTDYIDVLAVHEPSLDDIANTEIFDVLSGLVERGAVRAISVAGTADSIEAAFQNQRPVSIAQFPDSPFMNAAQTLRACLSAPTPMFVTHGVYGSSSAQRFARVSKQHRATLISLAQRHGFEFSTSPYDSLLRFAFSNNPDGVVILSMFDPEHIEANVAVARLPSSSRFATEIRNVLASATA